MADPSTTNAREPSDHCDFRQRTDGPSFVIQEHDATTLHYDLRLEIGGVLASWAVPKGPSTDPREKRLAIRTGDHDREYAKFEGPSLKRARGVGAVLVWDAGPFCNLKKSEDGSEVPLEQQLDDGHLAVWLEGEKLRGGYALTFFRFEGERELWLLVKMRDTGADARRKPVSTQPRSVLTGRTIEEIEAEGMHEAGE